MLDSSLQKTTQQHSYQSSNTINESLRRGNLMKVTSSATLRAYEITPIQMYACVWGTLYSYQTRSFYRWAAWQT